MSIADEIQKLQTLRDSNVLSEAEFNQAKTRLLNDTLVSTTSKGLSNNSIMAFIQNMGRSHRDSIVGGVCGGLAIDTPLPAWVWRLIFAGTTLLSFGSVAILYALLWAFMPFKDENMPSVPSNLTDPHL